MYKMKSTWKDYNGEERTQEFLFDLSESELYLLENSVAGGFSEMMKTVMAEKNLPEAMKQYEKLLHMSYGVKSNDGFSFVKADDDPSVWIRFHSSGAYNDIFMRLLMNKDGETVKFLRGITPESMRDKTDAQMKELMARG